MPTCKKCGSHFSWRMKIGGVQKYLGARKYCLECSPFKLHNTRQLEHFDPVASRKCADCGKPLKSARRRKCSWCYVKRSWNRRRQRLRAIVRNRCCLCGYNDKSEFGILHFHHVDPTTKVISVSTALRGKMTRVVSEALKCVPVCSRCHDEIHAGLVELAVVVELHDSFWNKVRLDQLKELVKLGGYPEGSHRGQVHVLGEHAG